MNATIDNHLKSKIDIDYLLDESIALARLNAEWGMSAGFFEQVQEKAKYFIEQVRSDVSEQSGIHAFLVEYDLSSNEGVVLMCLAEALLRIPDAETADRFIQDRLTRADWRSHLDQSESLFVNAGTWALMLSGAMVRGVRESEMVSVANQLFKRLSAPLVRSALREAMRFLGQQFILGSTLESAVSRRQIKGMRHQYFSYDMLGEAAVTDQDAVRYFELYKHAIKVLGHQNASLPWKQRDSISIKLSALHPRFDPLQHSRVMQELTPKLYKLIVLAKQLGIGVTIDAEEASRLKLSVDVFQKIILLLADEDWDGFGVVVQAYQKRALPLIEKLRQLSLATGKKIPVRLVKGAYWDAEIKTAQESGVAGFPVYTRKCYTDISYLVCAKALLQSKHQFYPQFATHNPLSLSAVLMLATNHHCSDYEIQRLHGMGESLYGHVLEEHPDLRCRLYAPVGGHKDLLPYLVRRLLENGANTSFVNRISDQRIPMRSLLADPFIEAEQYVETAHPKIKLSADLFLPNRVNSAGVNFNSELESKAFLQALSAENNRQWHATALVANSLSPESKPSIVKSLNDAAHELGSVVWTTEEVLVQALQNAVAAKSSWAMESEVNRRACLLKLADLIESNQSEFCYLLCHEAGKTMIDAVSEIREAVDFCRYYASQAEDIFAKPSSFVGPTGESNLLQWHARGVFVCISPWNFPLAIVTGQIAAALVMGNPVLLKPASATVLIAHRLVTLCYEARIPVDVLSFLPCDAQLFMSTVLSSEDIAGVAFTGSAKTATAINRCLANRSGAIAHLIAETGGINCMIVDSSALVEQVAVDVVGSAFNSAGQRCSALRVLFVQQDIAVRLIELIIGVIDNLSIGDCSLLSTDMGPLISTRAASLVNSHIDMMTDSASLIYRRSLPAHCRPDQFIGPTVIEIDDLNQLQEEIFGPVLHIIRYSAASMDSVLQQINQTQFGLTLGVHSRIESTVDYIVANVRVGNIYVNRDMIGAVVGVQPFGGEGLSGTGPKAGGPNYLYAFAVERMVTKNTTAIGGNATLLSLQDDET